LHVIDITSLVAEDEPMTATDEADGHDLVSLIKQMALRRLTAHGPAGLDLDAVADHAGITHEELRACFARRENLLTAMILDAYNDMGAEAEAADRWAIAQHASPLERWQATCRSIRLWAQNHPHEYALIWGPPLPGYSAPPETMIAGSRAALVLIGILRQTGSHHRVPDSLEVRHLSPGMRRNIATLSDGMLAGVPDLVIARVLIAWTQLLGAVSFAVYGQVREFASDPAAFFDHASAAMGRYVGLPG
jgi:AcrR family transcriptional regulator